MEKELTKRQLAKKIKRLFAKAWKLWSEFRRKSEADNDGMVICFSCGKRIPWRRPKDKKQKGDFANLGHFMHDVLDFDPMNTKIQCTRCNGRQHGNLGMYAIMLVKMYGLEAVEDLIKRAESFKGHTVEELEETINKHGRKDVQVK